MNQFHPLSLRKRRRKLRDEGWPLYFINARIVETLCRPLRQELHEQVVNALEPEVMPRIWDRYMPAVR